MSSTLKVHSPLGEVRPQGVQPLTTRLPGLAGRRILFINSWAAGAGFEPMHEALRSQLLAEHPGAEFSVVDKPTMYATDDPDFWSQVVENHDAFIYAGAPSASTTHYAVHYTALLEQRGRPGVALAYDTLEADVLNSLQTSPAPVRWHALPYPLDKLPAPKLQAFAASVLESLLRPLSPDEAAPSAVQRAAGPAFFTWQADALQDEFHERGWTDGLPVVPPTPSRVEAMLAATSHREDEVLAEAMGPEGRRVTVLQAAVNAVMAGCAPAAFPAVLAAIEAFNSSRNLNAASFTTCARSTNSFAFVQMVNGPFRHEIGMNAGLNALGPGSRANATLGRALRLAMINLGGVAIGKNAFPVQGNPAAYSFAFAENEEASPWPAYSADAGQAPEDSVLTLWTGGWSHVGNYIEAPIDNLARDISTFESPSGVLILLSPQRARHLAEQGHDKEAVRHLVWSLARRSAREFRGDVYWKALIEPNIRLNDERRLWPKAYLTVPDDTMIPVFPEHNVRIVVVGGEISPMAQAWKVTLPVSVSIDAWR
ncbi:MAG: hypothetical protein AB7E55_23230 [Pigmentiphaga sp.]